MLWVGGMRFLRNIGSHIQNHAASDSITPWFRIPWKQISPLLILLHWRGISHYRVRTSGSWQRVYAATKEYNIWFADDANRCRALVETGKVYIQWQYSGQCDGYLSLCNSVTVIWENDLSYVCTCSWLVN